MLRFARNDGSRGILPETVSQSNQTLLQRGEEKPCGRRGSRLAQFVNVSVDAKALDRSELRHALRRQPIEKLYRRARIGAARVRVADRGGEEFEEAIRGARAARGDERRAVSGGDGGELLVQGVAFAGLRVSTMRRRWLASITISAASSGSSKATRRWD